MILDAKIAKELEIGLELIIGNKKVPNLIEVDLKEKTYTCQVIQKNKAVKKTHKLPENAKVVLK